VIFIACLLWLVVCVYVICFVQWMIGGDIDVITGILGIGLFVGLGITLMAPPVPELWFLSLISLVGSAVMLPVLRVAFHRRDKRMVEVDGIRLAYEGFVMRPNNPAAMMRMARHLWNMGIRGHAYALAETALPNLPRQYYPDEHRMVAMWRAHPPKSAEFTPIHCVECGAPNPPGTIHCAGCGARYLLHRAQGRVLSSGLGRKLLGAWIVMMIALAGMPLATRLPGTKAAVAVVALMVAAVGALVLAFRPTKGTA
jgi:ribosomal protein L40E